MLDVNPPLACRNPRLVDQFGDAAHLVWNALQSASCSPPTGEFLSCLHRPGISCDDQVDVLGRGDSFRRAVYRLVVVPDRDRKVA